MLKIILTTLFIFACVAAVGVVFTIGFSEVPVVAWIVFTSILVFCICYFNGVFGSLYALYQKKTKRQNEV